MELLSFMLKYSIRGQVENVIIQLPTFSAKS